MDRLAGQMIKQRIGKNIKHRSIVPEFDLKTPFGLVEAGHRGIRLSAVNVAAQQLGIQAGDALADARSILPSLAIQDAQPIADRTAVRKLAYWCGRYGVLRNAYGIKALGNSNHSLKSYGLWIDISGVAHLYGGERGLLLDLERRLEGFGITARAAVSDTLGAAHALAWYGLDEGYKRCGEQSAGGILDSIAHLPIVALRLDHSLVQVLTRLGFKHIGALASVSRVALERRFRSQEEGQRVLRRLDQALGLIPEPRRSLMEPPALSVQQPFFDPLITSDGFENEVEKLISSFCIQLDGASLGARVVRVVFFRSDGTFGHVEAALSQATSKPKHILRLLQHKLRDIELGFGVDLLSIDAVQVEKQMAGQGSLVGTNDDKHRDLTAQLVDRLANRLGNTNVTQIGYRASHWPERSDVRFDALDSFGSSLAAKFVSNSKNRRPILLLQSPERISVTAEIPEGAPAQLIWRRVPYKISRSTGPERIEAEWWRILKQSQSPQVRDYYILEDDVGAQFWVFRSGRYDDDSDAHPGWYIHGIFS